MNSDGWWLYFLVIVFVGNGGCEGGVVVAAGVITLLGIFNPAQCATLRRVVPGGTIFVPPYLICTLCQPCGSHKSLGNHFMSSPGNVEGCGVGAAELG